MKVFVQLSIFFIILYQPIFACRLWAVCTKSNRSFSNLSDLEKSYLINGLDAYYDQSNSMPNGWSLLLYEDSTQSNLEPLYRSNSPASNDSSIYWETVDAIIQSESGKLALGHLRLATTGANNIPNPHPWMFHDSINSFSLIHNGTINKEILKNLITEYGQDQSWLIEHQPQTFDNGDWQNGGWDYVVDSELLLLYIMKKIYELDNTLDGLKIALGNIINNGVSINQLNIIFSDGYSLYVFGKSNGLYIAESDEYFTVMTIPPNNRLSTALSWSGINYGEMIVINSAGKTHYANINDSNIVLPSIIGITLEPSYPNPFNGAVTIPFSMDDNATGIISIFSLKGERISRITLSSSDIANGYIKWNPNNSTIASGAYYIFAESNGLTDYNKILFIK